MRLGQNDQLPREFFCSHLESESRNNAWEREPWLDYMKAVCVRRLLFFTNSVHRFWDYSFAHIECSTVHCTRRGCRAWLYTACLLLWPTSCTQSSNIYWYLLHLILCDTTFSSSNFLRSRETPTVAEQSVPPVAIKNPAWQISDLIIIAKRISTFELTTYNVAQKRRTLSRSWRPTVIERSLGD